MNLEDELPRLFDELANDHTVGSPHPHGVGDVLEPTPTRRRSSILAGIAAAGIVALLVGGLVVLTGRDARPGSSDQQPGVTTTSAPPTTNQPAGTTSAATLLAPSADSGVQVVSLQDWDRSGIANGAVVAPDGTVFSIVVGGSPSWLPDDPEWDTIPEERRGIKVIAGYDVAAVVDESSPTQIYRTVRDDCWSIEIVTAGTPMWTDDLTTLIGAITPNRNVEPVDRAAVTVAIPDGWSSLGGGRFPQSWTMNLQADIDGVTHDVYLAQVPDAPVGLLVSGESNPAPYDHNGQQWWTVDTVTRPGMTSLIGDAGLGAFSITSDLPAAQLAEIIDSLTPTPSNQLPSPQAPTDTAVPDVMVEQGPTDTRAPGEGTAPPATACGTLGTGLELIEP